MNLSEFRAWLETLADAEAMVPARVMLERLPDSEVVKVAAPEPDRLLTVKEAAERLGVAPAWIYRRADSLPFVRKLSVGTLRFSERALEKWMAGRR